LVFTPDNPQSVIQLSETATSDNKFSLAKADLWLEDVNIHIQNYDAYYGDMHNQNGVVYADDVISYRYVNIAELYFKNYTAGSNVTIVAIGIPIQKGRLKTLGVID